MDEATLEMLSEGNRERWDVSVSLLNFLPSTDRLIRWLNNRGLVTCAEFHPAKFDIPSNQTWVAVKAYPEDLSGICDFLDREFQSVGIQTGPTGGTSPRVQGHYDPSMGEAFVLIVNVHDDMISDDD
jgi:hypothetical protein